FAGGAAVEDLAQLGLQLAVAGGVIGDPGTRPALEQVGASHALAEVLPELTLRRLEQDEAVLRRVDLVTDAVPHAGRAGRPPLVAVGLVAGHLVLGPLVGLPRLAAVPVHGSRCIRLGDLHAAALAGLACADDAGEDAERPEQRPGVHAHRRVLGDVREALVVDAGHHEAGPRV